MRELIVESFKKLDIEDACRKSGAILKEEEGQKIIILPYLGSEYLIHFPDGEITTREKNGVGIDQKIVLLHYLISSKGTPFSGKLIDFRQVPDGNFYYSTLVNLVHRPFLQAFGEKPELFLEASKSLGGIESEFKDISMKFLVLPKVPVIAVLYKGDEEFSADCKFLFDSNIPDYLSTEGIVKVCEELVNKLKKHSNG